MSIESICRINVVTAEKSTPVRAIAVLMQQNHVGSVVIVENFDGGKIPAGIITDRDLALSIGEEVDLGSLRAVDLMQAQPVIAKLSDTVFTVAKTMARNGIKRLPVVKKDGSLFGIICADDVLREIAAEMSSLSEIAGAQIKKEAKVRLPTMRQVGVWS